MHKWLTVTARVLSIAIGVCASVKESFRQGAGKALWRRSPLREFWRMERNSLKSKKSVGRWFQLVKCLAWKHEDLSLNQQPSRKSWAQFLLSVPPEAVGQDLWSLLAYILASGSAPGSVRNLVLKNKVECDGEWHPTLTSDLDVNVHTCACISTPHMDTHRGTHTCTCP